MTTVPGRLGETRGKPGLWELRAVNSIWHFFCSMKVALFLILAIAGAVLIGTLLEQVPPSIRSDAVAYDQWLDRVESRYGMWTPIFARLELFNIFHTFYFRALLGLLVISTAVCTINRWRGVWVTAFHTRVRMTDAFFRHARHHTTLSVAVPADEASRQLRKTLSRARYHVSTDRDETSVAMFGSKNRLAAFGTFITHLAIILILAGAVIGGIWGFKDSQFVVAEGSTKAVQGTNLAVRLEHFADEYYVDGAPKDYKSEVTLLENGKEVKQATVRVNSPMRYKGVAFHQAFYGQTAIMKVQDGAGNTVYSDGVPLAWQTRDGGRPVGGFMIPGQNLSVWIIGPRSGENDPLIPPGEMRVEMYRSDMRVGNPENLVQGRPEQIQGYTFTFERETRFTGLKVVKDPGVNIIWIASALMVLGMVLLFYLPRRRVWAVCREGQDGMTQVMLAMPAQRDQSLATEFERLSTRVARALGATPPRPESRTSEGERHV